MSALPVGAAAALRHRRLAAVLWLSLLASALVAWFPIRTLFGIFDVGAFREALLRGWDGWGMLSFLAFPNREIRVAFAAVSGATVVFVLLQVFLTGGVLRALIAGQPRPVLRLVVAESAGLFKPNLWATVRYVLTAVFWSGLLVAAPVRLLHKLGKDVPPHTFLPDLAFWWALAAGAIVLLNVGLRYDLARIALARGEAVSARGAYRVAKRRLGGSRPSAILLALAWIAIGVAVQALFTALGMRWNPHTNASTFWLFAFRQLGFFILATVRVGFWASLLAWEDKRRPVPSSYGA
ncbi:MAG: hypothetical protein WCC53_11470 [Thermoanaerobaculia bacterium]